jgi:glucose-6-phosphate isomerase
MGPIIEKFKDSKFIFVVGIGGSDLASKAVWNAITLHNPDISKKILFLESPDEREYREINFVVHNAIQKPEDITLSVVSKSGETAETLDAFHKIFDILSEKFGTPINERVLVISSLGTPLWKIAESKNMEKLPWENGVGGRFSAFTVAHTAILQIAGIDTEAYLAGGREMGEKCDISENSSQEDIAKNPALNLAKKIFENYGSTSSPQVNILDFFFFNSELEDLGKWCRQLIAESLGKENETGEKVGITPIISIGPTDLHSMLQLNLGGPKNRFTIFVRSLGEIDDTINEPAYENVVKEYEKRGLPFEKIEMLEINEYELGKFMAFMMSTTVELAKMLGVDPYDQPEVENYKKHLTHNN